MTADKPEQPANRIRQMTKPMLTPADKTNVDTRISHLTKPMLTPE